MLDVNDGKSGFQVDWHKEYPSYSFYRFEEGKKKEYRRVWVNNRKVKEHVMVYEN